MSVYTPPVFNVLADIWYADHVPASSPPDEENQQVQFYIYSRHGLNIEPGQQELWVPPIYIRLPAAANDIWVSAQIVECPAESGRYYRARWKDIYHLGFPNQYLVILVEQCDDEGNHINRDVGPGHPIIEGGGLGRLDLQFEAFGVATHGGGGGTVHTADGSGDVTITFLGAGVGTNT